MSFSVQTKDELARIDVNKRCCQRAELAALIKMDGIIQLSTGFRMALHINIENAGVARRVFSLIKKIYGIQSELLIRRKNRLKKNISYLVRLPSPEAAQTILEDLGIWNEQHQFNYGINEKLLRRECCRRAYLRGAFLGGGSVNSPEGTYHLEIITNNHAHAEAICELLNRYDLSAKISTRKNWNVVYLKESDHIVNLLSIMGAHSALLSFENTRVYKDMRNQVNRLVNCETANLNKTVNAAVRQVENIRLIENTLGLRNLPPTLREMAELRMQYPDVSLKELGEMSVPRVGKSGVNHRVRKLEKIAEEIREGQGKD